MANRIGGCLSDVKHSMDTRATISPATEPKERRSDRAAEWLRDEIRGAGGSLARTEVMKRGRAAGYSEKMLDRVRGDAGVEVVKGGGVSVWRVVVPPPPAAEEECLDLE